MTPEQFTSWVTAGGALLLLGTRGASWMTRTIAARQQDRRASIEQVLETQKQMIDELRTQQIEDRRACGERIDTLEREVNDERTKRQTYEGLLLRQGWRRDAQGEWRGGPSDPKGGTS